MPRRLLWAVVAVLALVALVLVVVAKTTDLLPGVAALARQPYPPPPDSRVVEAIRGADIATATPTVIATVLAVFAFALRSGGPRYVLLGLAVAVGVAIASGAKSVGPATTLPSGHAAYAGAILGFGAWLNFRAGHRLGGAAMVAVALVLCPARVLSGAHWPMDVVAGFAFGVAWLLAVLLLGARWADASPRGA